jgi:hypothetical protein
VISYANDIPMRHVARRDEATGLLVSEITEANLARLDEYSTSTPTSPSVGRVWKRERFGGGWILGHCYAHECGHCLFAWRRIVVIDGARCEDASMLRRGTVKP